MNLAVHHPLQVSILGRFCIAQLIRYYLVSQKIARLGYIFKAVHSALVPRTVKFSQVTSDFSHKGKPVYGFHQCAGQGPILARNTSRLSLYPFKLKIKGIQKKD